MKIFFGTIASGQSVTLSASMGVRLLSIVAIAGKVTLSSNQDFPAVQPAGLVTAPNELDSTTANNTFNYQGNTPVDGFTIAPSTGSAQIAIGYT